MGGNLADVKINGFVVVRQDKIGDGFGSPGEGAVFVLMMRRSWRRSAGPSWMGALDGGMGYFPPYNSFRITIAQIRRIHNKIILENTKYI